MPDANSIMFFVKMAAMVIALTAAWHNRKQGDVAGTVFWAIVWLGGLITVSTA